MRKVHKIIAFIIISLTVLSMTGCSKATYAVKNDNETLSNTPSLLTKDTIELEDSKAQEREEQATISDTTQEMYPQNETIISLSPDGKYRAEAYGTITEITAGGLYPYEGIRILSIDNDDVIWNMEPGGYTVSFIWSPDSRYAGIYYTGRIWGESIVVDIKNKKSISLPELDEIASYYGASVKPQESRPDPYFEIRGWEDAETVIVDFRWTTVDGEEFNGQYTFNIKTSTVVCH